MSMISFDKNNIINLLTSYKGKYPKEGALADEFISLINDYNDAFYRTNFYGHITGSAWVVDSDARILMMHHKKLNKWLQPGGHCDGEFDVINVAKREAQEETGLEDLSLLSSEILDIDKHYIPSKGEEPEHFHFDIRFIFKANHPEKIIKNDESNELKWFTPIELNQMNLPESIMRMHRKAQKVLSVEVCS
ncbi:NUDIX hydrolase [Rickettsiaceae bacterium]|nr:NUDIX hydrolase [Rickettsiaceae bacterium]